MVVGSNLVGTTFHKPTVNSAVHPMESGTRQNGRKRVVEANVVSSRQETFRGGEFFISSRGISCLGGEIFTLSRHFSFRQGIFYFVEAFIMTSNGSWIRCGDFLDWSLNLRHVLFRWTRFQGTTPFVSWFSIPGFGFQILDSRVLISGFRFWVSFPGFRIQVFDSGFSILGFRFQILDSRFLIPDFRFQIIVSRFSIPNSKVLNSNLKSKFLYDINFNFFKNEALSWNGLFGARL